MYLAVELIFCTFIIFTLVSLVYNRKNNINEKQKINNFDISKKETRLAILIVIGVGLMFYILGYILKADFLYIIDFRVHGFSISIIGIVLWLIICMIIAYFFEKLKGLLNYKK